MFKTRSTVKHNGREFPKDSFITDISEDDGKKLLDSGVVEEVSDKQYRKEKAMKEAAAKIDSEEDVKDTETEKVKEEEKPTTEDATPRFDRMNKTELLKAAKKHGVEVDETMSKSDILSKIQEKPVEELKG